MLDVVVPLVQEILDGRAQVVAQELGALAADAQSQAGKEEVGLHRHALQARQARGIAEQGAGGGIQGGHVAHGPARAGIAGEGEGGHVAFHVQVELAALEIRELRRRRPAPGQERGRTGGMAQNASDAMHAGLRYC